MPTHTIGKGRALVLASVPKELKSELGKLAFASGTSSAAIIRELIEGIVAKAKESGQLAAAFIMFGVLCIGDGFNMVPTPEDDEKALRSGMRIKTSAKRKNDLDTFFEI